VRIIHSDALDKVVQEKLGLEMRAHLKKTCTKFFQTSDPWVVTQGMEIAADFTKPGEGPEVIAIKVNKGLFLFSLADKSEQEWLETLRNLNKKIAPVPRKVLVKMVALRIRKLFNKREDQNRLSTEHPEWGYPLFDPFPDFTSIAALQQITAVCEKTLTKHYQMREFRKEYLDTFKPVFAKEGVDDAVVEEAWHMHVTQEVMES